MIRRSPTRIDMRLNDLTEYETVRLEREVKRAPTESKPENPPPWRKKATTTEIQDRIGYTAQKSPQPQPRPNLTL